jgi:hypothetical protein
LVRALATNGVESPVYIRETDWRPIAGLKLANLARRHVTYLSDTDEFGHLAHSFPTDLPLTSLAPANEALCQPHYLLVVHRRSKF